MRNAFAKKLVELAKEDPRIVLLSGDIGNRLFDPFKSLFKDRFYNCGVAEQNMASMAAGMAMSGLKPITYTIAPFNTTRCLEQIRVDICYHNLPVVIIGVGAGLSYASLGATHHSCEDISLLRSIPNLKVVCPGDRFEVDVLFEEALKEPGPVYLRIGKKNEPEVHSSSPHLKIGKAHMIKEGKDVCLISTGNILPVAVEVVEQLKNQDLNLHLIQMHTVKPLDIPTLEDVFSSFSLVCSLEEHSLIGGLGASIAEVMADLRIQKNFLRFGTKDQFHYKVGSQEFLREQNDLTPNKISGEILKFFNKEKPYENASCITC